MTSANTNIMVAEQQNLRQENSDWFGVLSSELQSVASRLSIEFKNLGCNGILVEFVTANKTGTPSFVLSIVTPDGLGNDLELAKFTAITANGTAIYFIHPHADPTATKNNELTGEGTTAVPRVWKIKLTYTGTPATDAIDTLVRACYVK